jgi:hypothetical protein
MTVRQSGALPPFQPASQHGDGHDFLTIGQHLQPIHPLRRHRFRNGANGRRLLDELVGELVSALTRAVQQRVISSKLKNFFGKSTIASTCTAIAYQFHNIFRRKLYDAAH